MGNSDGVCSCVRWAKQSGAEVPKFAGFCSKTCLITFDWTVYAAGESYCPVPICDELMNCGCGDKLLPHTAPIGAQRRPNSVSPKKSTNAN